MSAMQDECLERVVLTAEDIRTRVIELGNQIGRDYAGLDLVVIGVLKGAIVFLSDLIRAIPIPHSLEFIGASSYKNSHSIGHVIITKDVTQDLRGRHVLLVEDIYDTGLSMRAILDLLAPHRPASLDVCVLLVKNRPREHEIRIKYTGFRIPDLFVVGYGLDLEEKYRNLPCVGILKKEFCE